MWTFLWQFGWPPCQPQLQSRAAFGGTLQGYGMTVILKPQTKDKAHTAAHHFLLRAAVSINNMGIPCAHGSRGNWCSLRTTLPFPKVTHILYKDFKRLKHKEETEIILIVSLERTTVNILFFFFGCAGSLLLHVSYSLVAVHKLLMAVAPLVEEHGSWAPGHAGSSSCGALIYLSHSMWNLPRWGTEPMSPSLTGRCLTTGPPGKSTIYICMYIYIVYLFFACCFGHVTWLAGSQFPGGGAGGGLVTKLCPTLATPWTVACQIPLSVGFSRQEYWSGLPLPSLGDFPNWGIELRSLALKADSLPTELQGKPHQFPGLGSTRCLLQWKLSPNHWNAREFPPM